MDNLNSTNDLKELISNLQIISDKIYLKGNMTDELLELQMLINKYISLYDIVGEDYIQ